MARADNHDLSLLRSPFNPLGWGNLPPKLHPWSYALIAGVPTPGFIPANGMKGFERETGWDKKKGKGTAGATMTLTTVPPAEGTITLHLIEDTDFVDWDNFLEFLLYDPTRKRSDAYDIFHPALAPLRIKSVVIEKIAPLIHEGKGLYSTSLKLSEWTRPPAASATQTPSKSATSNPSKKPGSPPNPAIIAKEARMRSLMRQVGALGHPDDDHSQTRNSRYDG